MKTVYKYISGEIIPEVTYKIRGKNTIIAAIKHEHTWVSVIGSPRKINQFKQVVEFKQNFCWPSILTILFANYLLEGKAND